MPESLYYHPADGQRIRAVYFQLAQTCRPDHVPGFERVYDHDAKAGFHATGAEKEMVGAGCLDADRHLLQR